jgi:hypothetical protein
MNTIKELYSSPTTKILVVRFEGILCVSEPGSASNGYGDNPLDDLGD